MTRGRILLCAGGTGGHLFPAEATAHQLTGRGWEVHLATDERALGYATGFGQGRIHLVPSATPAGRNPFMIARAGLLLLRGFGRSLRLLRKLQPRVVAGFGGYPTVPPVLAAQLRGIPCIIHDANAVIGRANRLLARRSSIVALGFAGGGNSLPKTVVTGNPIRQGVQEIAGRPYISRSAEDPFHLLIFGGSQGAQFFGEILPAAIGRMGQHIRKRLRIAHQVRAEQIEDVARRYEELGVQAETAPFFADMPERIGASHFVVCRAGASTVSELCVIGRPALLVPYPFALDHDQALNAEEMRRAGGAEVLQQSQLTVDALAEILEHAIAAPEELAQRAKNAKKAGRIDAAARLADLIENLAEGAPAFDASNGQRENRI